MKSKEQIIDQIKDVIMGYDGAEGGTTDYVIRDLMPLLDALEKAAQRQREAEIVKGLEGVIGEDEKLPPIEAQPFLWAERNARNYERAEQRKRLASLIQQPAQEDCKCGRHCSEDHGCGERGCQPWCSSYRDCVERKKLAQDTARKEGCERHCHLEPYQAEIKCKCIKNCEHCRPTDDKDLALAKRDFAQSIECQFRCSDGAGKPVTEHLPGCPFYQTDDKDDLAGGGVW